MTIYPYFATMIVDFHGHGGFTAQEDNPDPPPDLIDVSYAWDYGGQFTYNKRTLPWNDDYPPDNMFELTCGATAPHALSLRRSTHAGMYVGSVTRDGEWEADLFATAEYPQSHWGIYSRKAWPTVYHSPMTLAPERSEYGTTTGAYDYRFGSLDQFNSTQIQAADLGSGIPEIQRLILPEHTFLKTGSSMHFGSLPPDPEGGWGNLPTLTMRDKDPVWNNMSQQHDCVYTSNTRGWGDEWMLRVYDALNHLYPDVYPFPYESDNQPNTVSIQVENHQNVLITIQPVEGAASFPLLFGYCSTYYLELTPADYPDGTGFIYITIFSPPYVSNVDVTGNWSGTNPSFFGEGSGENDSFNASLTFT